jgi:hypothetical protein
MDDLIIMLRGIDIIMWNILHIEVEYGDILENTVTSTEHCYGSE